VSSRPEKTRSALLLIDLINPLDFEGAEHLVEPAGRLAEHVHALRSRARAASVPVIYVNDNFDCWHLGFRELIQRLQQDEPPGLPLIQRIAPDLERDHFILKPMHSGFFRTPLEVLLQRLEIDTLILTGIAGDICVLFTANDAYMRGFRILVPEDCTISEDAASNAHALRQMARLLKADTRPSHAIPLPG
jgi:nicotinamidase-related amidase